jgi:hypothetical protein
MCRVKAVSFAAVVKSIGPPIPIGVMYCIVTWSAVRYSIAGADYNLDQGIVNVRIGTLIRYFQLAAATVVLVRVTATACGACGGKGILDD